MLQNWKEEWIWPSLKIGAQEFPASKSRGEESWTLRNADTPEKSEETTLCPHSQTKRESPSASCVPWVQGPRSNRGRTFLVPAHAKSSKTVTRSAYTPESRCKTNFSAPSHLPGGLRAHRGRSPMGQELIVCHSSLHPNPRGKRAEHPEVWTILRPQDTLPLLPTSTHIPGSRGNCTVPLDIGICS